VSKCWYCCGSEIDGECNNEVCIVVQGRITQNIGKEAEKEDTDNEQS
jgi:hypothetical protein